MRALVAAVLFACGGEGVDTAGGAPADTTFPYERLSTYGYFTGGLADLSPAAGVVPYEVAAELWSDGAEKDRFIVLPEGGTATWQADEHWTFPVGTTIIKNFSFATAGNIETRLLVLEDDGWSGHVYLWNDARTEANRHVPGARVEVDTGASQIEYVVPNTNQCFSCHINADESVLLGLTTPQVDLEVERDGQTVDQLAWLADQGVFDVAPGASTHGPLVDPFGAADTDARARSYLHANCAHCHREGGSGGRSGLVLLAWEDDPTAYGVCKRPTAAGGGAGGNEYDIDPGSPDTSIFIFRMSSVEPDIKMPELPNKLPDADGIGVVSDWIAAMDPECP